MTNNNIITHAILVESLQECNTITRDKDMVMQYNIDYTNGYIGRTTYYSHLTTARPFVFLHNEYKYPIIQQTIRQ